MDEQLNEMSPQAERGDEKIFAPGMPIERALEKLRLRLLDLTGMNRLINFTHKPSRSLRFVHGTIDGTINQLRELNARVRISHIPEPPKSLWREKDGRLSRPAPEDYASDIGINPSFILSNSGPAVVSQNAHQVTPNQVFSLHFEDELGKYCRKVDREAKLAIEETGANQLYLVGGFLRFPDPRNSDKPYHAPLLCLPVEIVRVDSSEYPTYYLKHTGEEIVDNLSLREKLKRDIGFQLPEYDDESDMTPEQYLWGVAKAVENKEGWKVLPMMTLALLKFSNLLLFRDLQPERWAGNGEENALLDHPIVKQVFEGVGGTANAEYAEEYAIDDHLRGDLPLIYDADSSQHSALIDVAEGKNRVIEGPPGTGKSQTITNLIAVAIHEGKKVLFMAEKLTALAIVKSRLARAGLAPYILELHSNKTNKKLILEDLETRIRFRPPSASELPAKLASLEEKRSELKVYAELLNSHVGNLMDLTIHQVIWRAERHRLRAPDSASIVPSLDYFSSQNVTKEQFNRMVEALRYLVKQHEHIGGYNTQHAMWGLFIEELSPDDDQILRKNLREYEGKFSDFEAAAIRTLALLQDKNVTLDGSGATTLLNLLANIAPSATGDIDFEVLPALFSTFGSDGVRSLLILERLNHRIQRIGELESIVSQSLKSPAVALESTVVAAQQQEANLRRIGHVASPRSALESCDEELVLVIAHAGESLRGLNTIAELAEIPFDSKLGDTRRLKVLTQIAVSAPRELLKYRHEGIGAPGAVAKLDDAIKQTAHIDKLHANLDRLFHLELAPNERDLFDAIRTLREGGRWYRIFQGEWRAATRLHKTISKSGEKQKWDVRLKELEQLQSLLSARTKLANDSKIKSICGVHFEDERSPFQDLRNLAAWVEESDAELEGAGVDISKINSVSVHRALIEELKRRKNTIDESLASLDKLEQLSQNHFKNAEPAIHTELGGQSWSQRIDALSKIHETLSAAIAFHKPLGLSGVSMEDLRQGLMATIELESVAELVNNDEEVARLLGAKHCGRETDLEPIFAAHTYGTLVKKAKTPPAVERLLIAQNAIENHARLAELTADIEIGWSHVSEFNQEMAKLGKFKLDCWVDAKSSDVAAYTAAIAAKGRKAVGQLAGLLHWAQYGRARRGAIDLGLGDFVAAFEAERIRGEHLEHAFAYRFYAAITKGIFESHQPLRQFSGIRHSAVRADFAELDKEIIRLRGAQVAGSCSKNARPPRGSHGGRVDEKTEMVLLEHLIPQQRPRMTVRKIMQRAGRAIQELKPVFMMGPQAVAQFLEPGAMHFDIIVMDEASQLRPEQAIGAIVRGAQLVVVGDPKQLPPTNFFSSTANEDDEDAGQHAIDSESILDTCISHFQPVRSLRWHYRSQHESLIAFSNQNFYRGNLVVFPSPHSKSKDLGVSYIYVKDGEYESQMNPHEARRVVDAAVEHILTRPMDSLGIVAPNVKQRDLISEMLEERLHHLPQATKFQEYWKNEGLDFFVKNLENVQGDERDSIIISTTYGPAKGTRVTRQNFSPINREGGWRRLNVLFTRAKKSVLVISSMKPDDITLDSKTPRGTRALRDYLQFAKTGIVPTESETHLPPDSDFEIAIIDVLERHDYEVTPQLGVAGFRIDIAVKKPGNLSGYLAAIECDGATYHSGVSVRDRDRIRQEILESLGWKGRIWRIWSTDWFRNPSVETSNLLEFLARLKSEQSSDAPEGGAEMQSPSVTSDELSVAREMDIVDNLIIDAEADIEVEVNDLVTYAYAIAPDKDFMVQISHSQTITDKGIVSQTTPLGATLLGATVGDIVVLRIPGKDSESLLVKAIKRTKE